MSGLLSRSVRVTLAALLGIGAAAVVPLATGTAHAADNGEWSVAPTPPANPGPSPRQYFFLESPPGQALTDSVRITNLTDRALSFQVYVTDAYNTERDAGFALRGVTEPQRDLGAWSAAAVPAVAVPAKASVDVPFTITVPANASPGDHVGGVVALEATPGGTTTQDGVSVAVQRAVGARIYLRVTGPVVPGLDVQAMNLDAAVPWLPTTVGGHLDYAIANTGNLHLPPTVDVSVTGLFGHSVGGTAGQAIADLLPGARGQFGTDLAGIWPIDVVTATVTATADGGVRATRSTTTVVISWPLVALLLIVIAGGIVALRRRRQAQTPPARPRGRTLVGAGDAR